MIEIYLFEDYRVRTWNAKDAESLEKYGNDRDVWINLTDTFPHPYELEDAKRLIKLSKETDDVLLAISNETEAIGAVGLHFKTNVWRKNAEIGYWIGKPYWNKGIVSAAIEALVAHGFKNYGIQRIYTGVFEWNKASVRVLEKCGFRFEGKLRMSVYKDEGYTSEIMYSILREEWEQSEY